MLRRRGRSRCALPVPDGATPVPSSRHVSVNRKSAVPHGTHMPPPFFHIHCGASVPLDAKTRVARRHRRGGRGHWRHVHGIGRQAGIRTAAVRLFSPPLCSLRLDAVSDSSSVENAAVRVACGVRPQGCCFTSKLEAPSPCSSTVEHAGMHV